MKAPDKKKKAEIVRNQLIGRLLEEHCFWSYDETAVSREVMPDARLIAMTMRYLDLPEIDMLFSIFPKRKIKEAWKSELVPEGEYLYTLNRFFAWYYFDAKHPDAYLKSLQTRYLNSLQET